MATANCVCTARADKAVLVPQPPALARPIDRVIGDRTTGPILLNTRRHPHGPPRRHPPPAPPREHRRRQVATDESIGLESRGLFEVVQVFKEAAPCW
jgi:hypothetical protein